MALLSFNETVILGVKRARVKRPREIQPVRAGPEFFQNPRNFLSSTESKKQEKPLGVPHADQDREINTMRKATIAFALLALGCAAGTAQAATWPVVDSDGSIRDFLRRNRWTLSALRYTRDPFTFAPPKIEREAEPDEDRNRTRQPTGEQGDLEPDGKPPRGRDDSPRLINPLQILEKKHDDAWHLLMQTQLSRDRASRAVRAAEDALSYLETETFSFRAAEQNAVLLIEEDLLRILTVAQRLKARSAVERRFTGLQLRIHGVIWTPAAPRVVVNGNLLQEGDSIHDARVLAIEPKTVTFLFEETRFRVLFKRPDPPLKR